MSAVKLKEYIATVEIGLNKHFLIGMHMNSFNMQDINNFTSRRHNFTPGK